MAKKLTTPKKRIRNRAAQDATLINLRALKQKVDALGRDGLRRDANLALSLTDLRTEIAKVHDVLVFHGLARRVRRGK